MTERFYFFGDSICFGQYVSPHHVWVTRLATALEQDWADRGDGLMVQNPSISGNTTRMALERMAYDVTAHRPDFAWVQFGMNDSNYWQTDGGVPRTSRDGFRANLLEIAARLYAVGARHVFLATNHPSSRDRDAMPGTPVSYQQSNALYNQTVRDACFSLHHDGHPVTLMDMEAHFLADRAAHGLTAADYVLEDEVHLNRRGHDLYFAKALPELRAVLAAYQGRERKRAHG